MDFFTILRFTGCGLVVPAAHIFLNGFFFLEMSLDSHGEQAEALALIQVIIALLFVFLLFFLHVVAIHYEFQQFIDS